MAWCTTTCGTSHLSTPFSELVRAGPRGVDALVEATRDTAEAVAVLEEDGVDNAGVLYDRCHLTRNDVDPDVALSRDVGWVRHAQGADDPGRGAAGAGTLDLGRHFAAEQGGYTGSVELEYTPAGPSGPALAGLSRPWCG